VERGPTTDDLGDALPDSVGLQSASLRLTIVDRDRSFVRALAMHVRDLGWNLSVQSGPASASALEDTNPHAVLVDIVALGPRWEHWLGQQMARLSAVGLLVCTERSSLKQRIRGLHAGADDWITKPCPSEEVAARVHSVVRAYQMRASWNAMRPIVSVGLEVRPDLYDALVDGRPASLTRREFDVLICLARANGDVIPRERLYREVWGYATPAGDRALDTCVRKIRAKLRRLAPERAYVHTHWGVGYRFGYERTRGR
jgi:DNA-binding response OmpR family regulator